MMAPVRKLVSTQPGQIALVVMQLPVQVPAATGVGGDVVFDTSRW
jgi:hypothetical protein